MKSLLAITTLLLCSCWSQPKKGEKTSRPPIIIPLEVIDTCAMEKQLISMGLVNVQEINATIEVELRYADTNNFLHITLYNCLEKAFLQKDEALKLDSAQRILTRYLLRYRCRWHLWYKTYALRHGREIAPMAQALIANAIAPRIQSGRTFSLRKSCRVPGY